MPESNLISVIIPTRNVALDIDACLESLRRQTFQQFDIWVIDAQSTDGTIDKVNAYASKAGTALHCRSEPDLGVYDAMNKGILHAQGDWLYFLGADDIVHDPGVFAELAVCVAEGQAEIVYGDVVQKKSGARLGGESSLDSLLFKGNICHQAVLYHRSVFKQVGGYNLRYPIWADWELNIRSFRHPDIRTRWINRLIAVYNDNSGLSQEEDPVFKKELPVTLLRDAHSQISAMEKKIARLTGTLGYRMCKRLFGWTI